MPVLRCTPPKQAVKLSVLCTVDEIMEELTASGHGCVVDVTTWDGKSSRSDPKGQAGKGGGAGKRVAALGGVVFRSGHLGIICRDPIKGFSQ